jgi:hypothetical protein
MGRRRARGDAHQRRPSGVKVEIAGIEFNLLPLTDDQLRRFQLLTGAIMQLGELRLTSKVPPDELSETSREVSAAMRVVVHDILHECALANGLIDDEQAFEEWFGRLSLADTFVDTFEKLAPKLVMASMPKAPPQRLTLAMHKLDRWLN